MKIALIGYGKMGHEIEKIALDRGHEIVCTIEGRMRKERKNFFLCFQFQSGSEYLLRPQQLSCQNNESFRRI